MAEKKLTRKQRLKEVATQDILNAAEIVLADVGMAEISMVAVAENAGVSVGTLYNYFKDKDELLQSLMNDRRAHFASALDVAMAQDESLPFEAQLEAVVGAILRLFDERRNFLRIVLQNEKPTFTLTGQKHPQAQFVDRLRPLITRGIAEKVLAPEGDDLYAAVLGATLRGVMIERLFDKKKRPFTDTARFVVRMFLDGSRRKP